MKDLELVRNVKKQVLTDSLMVAEYFQKRHSNVLRDVRRLLERGILTKEDVVEDVYESSGIRYPMFHLGEEAVEILKLRRKIHTTNYRAIQKEYVKIILDTLPRLDFTEEYEFLNGEIRVDLYCPELNLAIEIDEKEHCPIKDEWKDVLLERELKKISSKFGIVRVKEGELGVGLRYILYYTSILSPIPIVERVLKI